MLRLEKAFCSLSKMVLLLMAIITWNTEETSLCNKKFILSKKVHYSTICDSLPHSKFCYQLSQWKCPWLYQKRKLISKFLWPQPTWLCNLKHHEKDTLQELKAICFSAAMSYAWDRLIKKFINNSNNQ